jgi:hypothetical protein
VLLICYTADDSASAPNLTVPRHCFAWAKARCAVVGKQGDMIAMRRVLDEFVLFSCISAFFMGVAITAAALVAN